MKASGFIELVIIVAALVMGLPLFLACNKMANMDVNTIYMNDKSTWQIAADIEWELNENGVLIPTNVIENLIKHFGQLKNVLEASSEDLDQVEGIGEARAAAIKNGLKRIKEQVNLKKEL